MIFRLRVLLNEHAHNLTKLRTACVGVLFMLIFVSGQAEACQPWVSADSDFSVSVKRRFDNADTVVIATLLSSRKLTIKTGLSFDTPAEEDIFRVHRVFKGAIKAGDSLVLTTALIGCGVSAINDPVWVHGASSGTIDSLARKWLIYRNSNENTQMTASPFTQMSHLAEEEIVLLKKLQRLNQIKKLKKGSG